jgi:alkanesulfonate monooxygenase SsuD/methylene tetrahydromethanopterin reductase-like flavin-dependent oxidoreductase (luciferase family)
VDFEGKWFRTHGPLNSGPCPQGRPVIAQAGGSARGRQFASGNADTIVASLKGAPAMRAYRDDVRARAVSQGRNPDHVKVLFLVNPIIGGSMDEALAKKAARLARAEAQVPQPMEEVGGDGFLFSMGDVSRRTIAEVADGLVPALQRRGLTRRAYAFEQFRDNLREF